MNWIINNPIDAFQLAWSIALKYCAVFCLMTIVMAILFSRLLKSNSVAVKNSAHRHATTFDISYTQFVPDGVSARSNRNELKAVLAEVLRDLQCYVKYE